MEFNEPERKNIFGQTQKPSARKKNSPRMRSAQQTTEYKMQTRKQKRIKSFVDSSPEVEM